MRRSRPWALGQIATLPTGVLGHEWDEDLDNGFRPAGLFPAFLHHYLYSRYVRRRSVGHDSGAGTGTHSMTLYGSRAAPGFLARVPSSGPGGWMTITTAMARLCRSILACGRPPSTCLRIWGHSPGHCSRDFRPRALPATRPSQRHSSAPGEQRQRDRGQPRHDFPEPRPTRGARGWSLSR